MHLTSNTGSRERMSTRYIYEVCSLVDHIQQEDHSVMLNITEGLGGTCQALGLDTTDSLITLLSKIREHMQHEKKHLFPAIRKWAHNAVLTRQQKIQLEQVLQSKYVYGWSHILDEFQKVQDEFSNDEMLEQMDKLGEELCWYVKIENSYLFPILSHLTEKH